MATFSFVAQATSTSGTIVVPASAQAGDLAILCDSGAKDGGVPGDFSITGWTATSLNFTFNSNGSFVDQRTKCFYKILTATDPGATVTGQNVINNGKVMYVYRPSHVISTVSPAGPVSSAADTNPGSVSINAGSGAAPVIAVAFWRSGGAISPRTMSPAMDAEVNIVASGLNNFWSQRKLYNSSPANHTADIDDEGNSNAVSGLYFTCTFGVEIFRGTLTATEAPDTISADAEVTTEHNATLTATEPRDAISATAMADAQGTVSATEVRDAISADAIAEASANLGTTEARDAISSQAEAPGTATLDTTEPRDAISSTATADAFGTLDVTEARDAISSNAIQLGPLSFIDKSTSVNNANITIPATAQTGDFCVLLDGAFQSTTPPDSVVPSGWTSDSDVSLTGANSLRAIISHRVIGAGEAGTVITGMSGSTVRKTILVFRSLVPITAIQPGTPNQEASAGNPAQQTISMSGKRTPVLGLVHYYSNGAIDPRTASPAMTEVAGGDTRQYSAYQIYSSSPADHTVDMDDEGQNALQSLYFELAFNYATLTGTEARDAISSSAEAPGSSTLVAAEVRDAIAATAEASAFASLVATEPRDQISSSVTIPVTATVDKTEARDVIASLVQMVPLADLDILEARDQASIVASAPGSATLQASEPRDAVDSTAQVTDGPTADVQYAEPRDSISSSAYAATWSPYDYIQAAWPSLFPDLLLVVASNIEIDLNQVPDEWAAINFQGMGTNAVVTDNHYSAEDGRIQVAVFRRAGLGFTGSDALARTVARALLGHRSTDRLFHIYGVSGPLDLTPQADGGWYGLSLEVSYTLRSRRLAA